MTPHKMAAFFAGRRAEIGKTGQIRGTAAIKLLDLAESLTTLADLQDRLLVCYRVGRNPGSVLDKLAIVRASLAHWQDEAAPAARREEPKR